VEGRGHDFVPKTPEEHVKNANLLLTMPIPWSEIVIRVGLYVLDVYLSTVEDSKGIGPMWKVGDTISCRKHQQIIQKNIITSPLMF